MRLISSIVLAIALCVVYAASAQTPTTHPATQPMDCSTPLAFMTSYDHLAGQEPAVYQEMFYTDNDNDALRLAKTEARFDAQVGMLQKIVQKKWGDDGVDQTLHALGLKSMRDIQSASIKDMGHRATVTFADGTPGPELVKTAKGWRLDLPAFARSLGMPVDDYLKQLRQISKVLPDVADAIVSGKLSQPSDVVQDVVKRLNAVAP